MRKVRVNPDRYLDEGCSGQVYRYGNNRVIKVVSQWALDNMGEIEGSKLSRHCVPILEVVKIANPLELGFNSRFCYGLIKPYIPHEATWYEAEKLQAHFARFDRLRPLTYDCYFPNVRLDNNGKAWLIDTELHQ